MLATQFRRRMRAVLWLLGILAVGACATSNAVQCADGYVCPAGFLCDDMHANIDVRCVTADQQAQCATAENGTDCAADVVDRGICDLGVCLPSICGDGYRRDDEACDGIEHDDRNNCQLYGYYDAKEMPCNSACGYVFDVCTGECGDGVVDPVHELCDGAPPSQSCVDFGYGAGFLDCAMCGPGLADCKPFGWQSFPQPGFPQAVSGVSATEVYAVTGEALRRFDGGSWSDVDLAACALPANPTFTTAHAFAPGQVAIGVGSVVATLSQSGCTKQVVDTSSPVTIVDVWANAANDIYAASSTNTGGVYRYDGIAWTRVSTVPAAKVWAGGTHAWAAAQGGGSLAHFNGASWTTVPAAATGLDLVYAVWGTGPTDVYVGGQLGTSGAVSHFNGTSWTALPAIGPGGIYAVILAFGRPIAAGSINSRPYVGIYDGASWTDLTLTVQFGIPWSLWVSPLDTLYVAANGTTQVMSTTGATRTSTEIMEITPVALAVRDGSEAYAVVDGGDIDRLFQFDGITWRLDATPQDVTDVWIEPTTRTPYMLNASGGIHRRGSPNWTLVPNSPDGRALWGTSASDIWVISPGAGSVLEHFNGSSVDPCTTCTWPMFLFDLWGSSTNDVFAVGQDGTILHYNGAAWSAMTSGTTLDVMKIWGSGPNDVYAVASPNVLHYDGTAWTKVDDVSLFGIYGIWGSAADDVFIAGFGGFVYHFDGEHWSPVASGTSSTIFAIDGTGKSVMWADAAGDAHHLVRARPW